VVGTNVGKFVGCVGLPLGELVGEVVGTNVGKFVG
jgi:hypothetical protein